MKRFRSRLKPKVYIELTPLVDIIFILLIFFIFSYNKLKLSEYRLSLPDSSHGEELDLSRGVTIDIVAYKDGRFVIDGEEATLSELSILLRERLLQSEDADVVINADSETSIQGLISLMDAIKLSGFRKSPYVRTADRLR